MKKTLKKLRNFLPSKIPSTGVPEMQAFVADIIETYDLPDNDSHRQAIYNMILTLGPTIIYKSKYFFAASVMKAAANQIAYNLIMEIRDAANKPRPSSDPKPEVANEVLSE